MSIGKDGFTGYIPYHLEIEGRPELSLFPRNVAFSKKKNVNGKTIMGSALYEPDLGTFRVWQGKVSLRYHNIHGGNCWLSIEYGPKYEYIGKKFINDETFDKLTDEVGSALFTSLNGNEYYINL